MKIVINKCYGGFSISKEAAEFMAARGNEVAKKELEESQKLGSWYGYEYSRVDLDLIAAVEELGDKANGEFAKLKVVEIPDDVEYEIQDYDGIETIHEKHRGWY